MDEGAANVEEGGVAGQGGVGQDAPQPVPEVAAPPVQVQTTLPFRPVQQSVQQSVQQPAPAQAPVLAQAAQPAIQPQPMQPMIAPGPDPQLVAAEALIGELRKLPGVVPEVIQGRTVGEVQASLEAAKKAYEAVKGAVLKEQGASVPQARGGSGAPAIVPKTSLEMIEVGLAQTQARRR